jgi:hypothetical protein
MSFNLRQQQSVTSKQIRYRSVEEADVENVGNILITKICIYALILKRHREKYNSRCLH